MSRVGNLRGAPLFLRPSVVRGLIEGVDAIHAAIQKGLVQVPIAPIKLVDVPRRSEDPRLAKANDDHKPSGWVAPPVASEPEDWPDAPLPDHSDPDLDRPEPVEDAAVIETVPAKRVRKSRATGVKAAAEVARAERNRSMVEAYASGATVEALAAQHGISTWLVYTVIRNAGVSRAPGNAASPEIAERNAEVAKAYAAGEDVDALAARFGITRVNVYRIAKLAGTATRSKQSKDDRNRLIAEAYGAGEDPDAIAARFGIGRSTVVCVAWKMKVKRPRQERAPRPQRVRKAAAEAAQANAERNERLLAAYAAGTPLADLAAEFRLKPHYIRFLAKNAGVKAPRKAKVPRAPKPRAAKARNEAAEAPTAPVQVCLPINPMPHVAHEPVPEPSEPAATGPGFYSEAATKRRLQDAGRVRLLEEARQAKAQRTARRAERDAEADAAAAEFAAALERVRARREAGVQVIVPKPAAPVNAGAKLAEAIRRRDAARAAAAKAAARALERAPSREECPRCGVPGWKGCDHFLPCEDGPPPALIETADLRKVAKFTGSRQGISVLRIR